MPWTGRSDPIGAIATLGAIGTYVWSVRRSIIAARAAAETSTDVRLSNSADLERFAIEMQLLRTLVSANAKMSWAIFFGVLAISIPFAAPFPLNAYFHPWGQLALGACQFAFLLAVFQSGFWVHLWTQTRNARPRSAHRTN